MSIGEIIFYSYLIIGFCVMTYDWYKYQKPIYDQAKKSGMVEDNMAVMYMTCIIILWPIKIFN
jgi:hypothetical protein